MDKPEQDLFENLLDLKSTYNKFACYDNSDIIIKDEMQIINDVMMEIFDRDFLLIETEKLQSDLVLINNKFVQLLKFCKEEKNLKKPHYIFIMFCDFFNLDYAKTFLLLHLNLQALIKTCTVKFVGKDVYIKYVRKENSNKTQILSLFDLIKQK